MRGKKQGAEDVVRLIQSAAQARGDQPISRELVERAIAHIAEVSKVKLSQIYSSSLTPECLKNIYDIAWAIKAEDAFVRGVIRFAREQGDDPVPEHYIREALQRIAEKKVPEGMFPEKQLSFADVHAFAAVIQSDEVLLA